MIHKDQLKQLEEIQKLVGFARANLDHGSSEPQEQRISVNIAATQLAKARNLLDQILKDLTF